MQLYVSQDFTKGFRDVTAGTGSFSYSTDNKIFTATSPLGTGNSAYKEWHFFANAGDVIEISVFAKKTKGNPRIYLDLKDGASTLIKSLISEDVEDSEFKLHRTIVSIPYNVGSYTDAMLVLGVAGSTNEDSEGSFTEPKIRLVSSGVGQLQPMACGFIRVTNGVATVHPDYRNFGIKSVSYDDVSKDITVTLDKNTNYTTRPIIQATAIGDTPYVPLAGHSYSSLPTSNFKVALTNGTAKVSLASGVYSIYLKVDY